MMELRSSFSCGLTRNHVGKSSVEVVHLYSKLLVLHALPLGTMLEMQAQCLTKHGFDRVDL